VEEGVVGTGGMGEVDDGVGIPVGDDEGLFGETHEASVLDHGAGEDPGTVGQDFVFVDQPDE